LIFCFGFNSVYLPCAPTVHSIILPDRLGVNKLWLAPHHSPALYRSSVAYGRVSVSSLVDGREKVSLYAAWVMASYFAVTELCSVSNSKVCVCRLRCYTEVSRRTFFRFPLFAVTQFLYLLTVYSIFRVRLRFCKCPLTIY